MEGVVISKAIIKTPILFLAILIATVKKPFRLNFPCFQNKLRISFQYDSHLATNMYDAEMK